MTTTLLVLILAAILAFGISVVIHLRAINENLCTYIRFTDKVHQKWESTYEENQKAASRRRAGGR